VGKLVSLTEAHPLKLGEMNAGSGFVLHFFLKIACLPPDSSASKKSECEVFMKKMQKQLTNASQHIGQLEQCLVDDARQHRNDMQQVFAYCV
jgi:hypothetical protein